MLSLHFELRGRVRVSRGLLSPELGHLGISSFAGLDCAGTRYPFESRTRPPPFPSIGVQSRAAAVSNLHCGLPKTRNRGANQSSPTSLDHCLCVRRHSQLKPSNCGLKCEPARGQYLLKQFAWLSSRAISSQSIFECLRCGKRPGRARDLNFSVCRLGGSTRASFIH